jgi:hypothetical protein
MSPIVVSQFGRRLDGQLRRVRGEPNAAPVKVGDEGLWIHLKILPVGCRGIRIRATSLIARFTLGRAVGASFLVF